MPSHKPYDTRLLTRIERIAHIGHWQLDLKTNDLFWSDEVRRIHGLDFKDYKPDVETAIDVYLPEDRQDVEDALKNAIENKAPFIFQKRIRRPSGEIRHVISQGECELDKNGEVIFVFGTFQDITALKQQEELYELAALGSNAALWDWDIQNDTLRWSGHSARILGFKNNDDMPKTTQQFSDDLVHPDDREKLAETFANHFKIREEFSIDLRIAKHGNNYQWFAARAQAQWDEDGRATRICGSLTDISTLKETQDKLERSNNDLEQFAATAAHDLKAPLRTISGFLEILKNKYADKLDEEALEYIDFSVKGAQDLGFLIEDLLEYAGLGTEGLNIKSVNLDTLTKTTIRMMKSTIKETGATFEIDPLPTINCDEYKIKSLLNNLIENAMKYKSNAPPTIKIKVNESAGDWHFAIQDNGIGMEQKNLDDIFLMFNRLHNKQDYSGTGIGLAVCKKIVELHGGKIWAESETGKGSIFNFTIPKNL